MAKRPDAAPPKEPLQPANLRGDCELCGGGFPTYSGHKPECPRFSSPPPSDAAPVAQLLYDTMPDMISAILLENEIDPFVYAAKWAAAIGPLYAHPEDAPRFKPCGCQWFGEQRCADHERVEDAPGGPWKAKEAVDGRWFVWRADGANTDTVGPLSLETEALAVRDALNRVDRLKGEGETDG